MPQGWDLGVPRGVGGPKIFFPKFNQTYMCDLHEWHMQRQNFGVPAPWGLGEGPKGQISLNLNHKVNFKDFFKTLVVFSQMKDIKYIRRDFNLVAWVMPQGWDLGVPWEVGDQFFFPKFNQIWCTSYLHEWHMQQHKLFGSPPPGALGRGQKVKYH